MSLAGDETCKGRPSAFGVGEVMAAYATKFIEGKVMEKSRFDLEQGILNCWAIVEDIEGVAELVESIPGLEPKKQDEVVNLLLGIAALYQHRFEKTFDIFENLIENRGIAVVNEKIIELPEVSRIEVINNEGRGFLTLKRNCKLLLSRRKNYS
jgi:hypothetical protein